MKVSFVIPTFNCAAFLPHAVRSCLDQSYKDVEIVIVDDCSTDTTTDYLAWLAAQGHKNIKIARNGQNKGRSESRNIGNKLATGDIILVLDADDLAVKTRAEWTVKTMKAKKAKVVYGAAVVMDALGNALNEIPANQVDLKNCIERKQNGIVHSTMAYTKDIAEKYQYEGGEVCALGLDDYMLQLTMLVDGVEFAAIPDVLCAYRTHGEAITQKRDAKQVDALKNKIIEGLKCTI